LSPVAGPDAIVTPLNDERDARLLGNHQPRNDESAYNHMSATNVRSWLGADLWDTYLTIAVERNPWDRLVSLYFYEISRRPVKPSFQVWLQTAKPLELTNFSLYANDGRIEVKRLLRYEQLDDELRKFCAEVGLPPVVLPRAKCGFRPDRDYRRMYNEHSAAFVAEKCDREIQLMGYEF
jgi:hypothetical protein